MTYSLDIINASLNYYKTNKTTIRKTSKIFCVSKSSISGWIKYLPLKYNNIEKQSNKITPELLKFLKNSLNQNPYQTQKQMLEKINKKFSLDVSIHVIKTILKILKYTRKKAIKRLFNKNLKEHICNRNKFKKFSF